jgi:peptidoglycan/LPS O-acetylase OafA/YrhL
LLLLGRRRAGWLCLTLILTVPVVRVASYFVFPALRGHLGMMLHTRVDTLMFGCGLALAESTVRFRHVWGWIARHRVPVFAAAYLLIAAPFLARTLRGNYSVTVGQTLEGNAIAIMLFWSVTNSRTAIGRILNSPLLVHIGLISYSLYLWQQLFTGPIALWGRHAFLLDILSIFAAAELSYWFIERTFLSIRSKLARRTVSTPAPPQVALKESQSTIGEASVV